MIFLILSAFVGVTLFSKFYILRDYTLKGEVSCNPEFEICFERPCLEECDEESTATFYKIQSVHASDLILCDPHIQECPEVNCEAIDSCVEELCTAENVPEGETCSSPDNFMKETSEDEEELPLTEENSDNMGE